MRKLRRLIRGFLQWRFKTKKLHLNKIRPKNVTEFFVAHAQKRKTKITQSIATYLGHVLPSLTYWYLTGTNELLQLALLRLERSKGGVK